MNEQPPIVAPASVGRPSAVFGQLGRILAIVALAAVAFMILFNPG